MPAWTSRDDITEFGVSHTESGIPVRLSYPPGETSPLPPPGEFPYARGLRADGYRTRPWTFRQYAGFAGGTETNERLRYLVANGQSGLSIALDLPTQMGLDSDDPRAKYEVGRLGVAIDCLADMEALYDGIPIESISSSFTINATALVILAFYVAMADPAREAIRHRPERYAQGIRGPWRLHVSARAQRPALHRPHRVLRPAAT